MLTREERVQLLSQIYTEKLQEVNSMPENLLQQYKLWLRGKIKQAVQLQQSQAAPQQAAPEQQGQEAS